MSKISLFEFWDYYNEKTMGFLNMLKDYDLSFRPYPSMKTLGEELRHMADVRDIYLRAMTEGAGPSWKEKRMDPEMAESVNKLVGYYSELNERMESFRKSKIDWHKDVPWKGMGDLDIEACLNWLIHFECTHQGIVSVYIAGMGMDYDISG